MAIVTGANTGIGYHTAGHLHRAQSHINANLRWSRVEDQRTAPTGAGTDAPLQASSPLLATRWSLAVAVLSAARRLQKR